MKIATQNNEIIIYPYDNEEKWIACHLNGRIISHGIRWSKETYSLKEIISAFETIEIWLKSDGAKHENEDS